MSEDKKKETDWSLYPSVTLAYDIAKITLDTGIKRADLWTQSLEKTLAWGTTVTLALFGYVASQFGHGRVPDFANAWFVGAVILLALALVVAITGRFWGGISDFELKTMHHAWLQSEEAKFKADYVFSAGECCTKNAKTTLIKAWAVTVSSVLFILQGIALILWVLKSQ